MQFCLFVLLWSITLVSTALLRDSWIPYAKNGKSHYLKLYQVDANFFEAEENCQRRHGHLASFRSADEYEFIHNMFDDENQLWLGLFNYGQPSATNLYRFHFTDGQRFKPSTWRGVFSMIFVNQNEHGYSAPARLAVGHNDKTSPDGKIFCSALATEPPSLWVISVECDAPRQAHICKVPADRIEDAVRSETTTTMTTTTATTTTTTTTTTMPMITSTTPEMTTTPTTTTTTITQKITNAALITTVSPSIASPQLAAASFNAWAVPEITSITESSDVKCVSYDFSEMSNWDVDRLTHCGWRQPIVALIVAAVALALVLALCCWRCCCWLSDRRHSAEYRLAKAERARKRRLDAVYASFKHAPQPGDFYDDGDTTITDFVV